MTSRDFCFWLQGFFEIAEEGRTPEPTGPNSTFTPAVSLNDKQVRMVRNHLALVFKHEIDPSMPDPTGEMQAIHDGITIPSGTGIPGDMLLRC